MFLLCGSNKLKYIIITYKSKIHGKSIYLSKLGFTLSYLTLRTIYKPSSILSKIKKDAK
jgi:hypothetical protein